VPSDNEALLKLGDINAAIAPLSITAVGLEQLGFDPVATDKSAKLYRSRDLYAMYCQMSEHLNEKARQIRLQWEPRSKQAA